MIFTDLSSGNPTSWLWDFGDGNTSTQQNPTHTYTNAGTYNISLSINNNQDTKIENNYIEVNNNSNCIPDTYLDDDYCNINCTEFTHRLYAHYTGANEYRFTFKSLTDPSIPDVVITRTNGARTMHFHMLEYLFWSYEVSVECKFTNPNIHTMVLDGQKSTNCVMLLLQPYNKTIKQLLWFDVSNAFQSEFASGWCRICWRCI